MEFRISTSLTVEERERWDAFIMSCPFGHAFQSYAWGEFQEALTGRDVFYLIGTQNGEWRAVAQIFRRTWPWPLSNFGNYEISCGPAFLDFADLQDTLRYLDEWAAARAVQCYIGPRCSMEYYKRLSEVCLRLGFRPTADPEAPIYGEETVMVDLRLELNSIYKKIRYTTRYEIRREQNMGVTVRFANDADAIDTFYEIYRRQDVRKEIAPIDKRYFILLHKHFLSNPKHGTIAIAELNGQPLSVALCFTFGKNAQYRWGASDDVMKKQMSSAHLLHWKLIEHFKEAGYESYDFSGASPSLPKTYFSYGVNLFKTGFSKQFVKFTPDYVKSYRPMWSTAMQWRDTLYGIRNRIKGLRPFRLIASLRNRLDAQMSTAAFTGKNGPLKGWKSWPRVARVSAGVACLFLLTAGYIMRGHEPWRGEMRPWIVARDSPSTIALLDQISREGASPLWPLCLRILSQLHLTPLAMQFFNLILGTLLIFIFWSRAPFSVIQKILLTFNYYLFYQYTVVSSNYLLGLLFLAMASVFYETRWSRPARLALFLFLACITSRNAMIVALGMSSAFLWETLQNPAKAQKSGLVVMGIFAVNIFLTGMAMRPIQGVPYVQNWYLHLNIHRLLWLGDVYTKAFLAFPIPGRQFWGLVHLEQLLLSSKLMIFVSFAIFIWCAAAVRLRRPAVVFLTISTTVLMIFFYAGFLGIYRHAGFLFFTFLFSWWISRSEDRWTVAPGFLADTLVTGILVLQMAGGMTAAYLDICHPYSGGRAAATYISERGFPETLVSVGSVALGNPLSGYLDRPIFYSELKEWINIAPWDYHQDKRLPDEELVQRSQEEAIRRQMDLLMITDHPLHESVQTVHQLEYLQAFTGSITTDENYYLYLRRT